VRLKKEVERGSTSLVDLRTTKKMEGTTCESTTVKMMTVERKVTKLGKNSHGGNAIRKHPPKGIRSGQGGRPTSRRRAEGKVPPIDVGLLFTHRISGRGPSGEGIQRPPSRDDVANLRMAFCSQLNVY
jgi:hypothetical protein